MKLIVLRDLVEKELVKKNASRRGGVLLGFSVGVLGFLGPYLT